MHRGQGPAGENLVGEDTGCLVDLDPFDSLGFSLVLFLVVERFEEEEDEDEDDVRSNRSISFVSMEATRSSICLPGWMRSTRHTRLATRASKQAALSLADPRASSKNLARVC